MGYASDYLCEAGTTIIGRKGSINNPIYINTKFWNVDTAFGISSKPTMSSKFVYYFCKSFDFSKLNKGTTLPSLVKKDLLLIDIPAPPLSEQQRIVNLLDAEFAKIDALKANAEKNLQNAKDLFQAALKKELEPKEGWKTKTLRELSEDIGDGLHGTPKYSDDGTCYFINGNNLNDGRIVLTKNTKRVSETEKRKYYIPLDEQTILVSINGTLGKVAYYNGENVILGKSACYVILKKGIINKAFAFHIFASDIFMQYAEKEYTGLTIKNVSLKSMRNFPISYPSIEEQQKVVDNLNVLKDRCYSLQANYEKTLSLCDDLKQALLRKAFNGEI